MYQLYIGTLIAIVVICAIGIVCKAVSSTAGHFSAIREEARREAKKAASSVVSSAASNAAKKPAAPAVQNASVPKRRPGRPRKDPNAPPKPRKTGTITLSLDQFEALVKALDTTRKGA